MTIKDIVKKVVCFITITFYSLFLVLGFVSVIRNLVSTGVFQLSYFMEPWDHCISLFRDHILIYILIFLFTSYSLSCLVHKDYKNYTILFVLFLLSFIPYLFVLERVSEETGLDSKFFVLIFSFLLFPFLPSFTFFQILCVKKKFKFFSKLQKYIAFLAIAITFILMLIVACN